MSDAALSAIQLQTVVRRKMRIIADNVANVSTPGFKTELLAQTPEAIGSRKEDTKFVVPFGLVRDTREGNFTHTANPLDLAIQGKGFFVVQTPEGERYTRNGRFALNGEGQIVNASGHRLLGDDGQPITVPAGSKRVTVGADGTISNSQGELGTIGVVAFNNENKLLRVSGTLYVAEDRPQPAERARIVQGAVEESNVQPVVQITEMMGAMRRYQSAQRIVQAEGERVRKAIQTLTRAA